mmetsp:Transcript_5118/g.7787  ORF Transcript_5118/g.7787 Transcript_5118/m.7787 type:complete len:191 (+) Transcript_5118:174-746(+)
MASVTSSTLVPPTLVCQTPGSQDALECSIHTLPKPLLREFSHVFGSNYLTFDNINNAAANKEILAIPTNQYAKEDLVAVGDHIEQEKDRLLNVFIEFGKDLCTKLREKGYWADYIDPCSGLPMLSLHCNKVYSEVDGMECLLNYKAYNAGFCKILTHPKWGSSVYPATIFAYAPSSVVKELMNQYPRFAA